MTMIQNKTPEERKAIAAKSVATRRANIKARELKKQKLKEYALRLEFNIDYLEQKLEKLERENALSLCSAKLTGKSLLRSEEISSGALAWHNSSGVYFLLDGDEVVYVGQAKSVYQRIGCHVDKKFDRYAYVPCPLDMLDKLESLYIHCLQPKLNYTHKNGVKLAPIALEELIGT
jgi:hypothetical protein